MNHLGKHIILELYNCNPKLINCIKYVELSLLESANIAKCNVLHKYFHRFCPQGITGIVAVSESHFSIHTWPEHNYCAIDIFCCKDDLEASVDYLIEAFQSKKCEINTITRGKINETNISNS